ncbi:PREDICTED: uncharacterized protein LOC107348651 [Acropora digitifera]|uniref:uncharacterized protein LOC107348651 n=1 Tax=Acropora digitifera TaxID=70779 RepID=UPI00077A0D6A|nr:PREDICTED: uncharacterized protein LOC107348651 [Acropora digitifera]
MIDSVDRCFEFNKKGLEIKNSENQKHERHDLPCFKSPSWTPGNRRAVMVFRTFLRHPNVRNYVIDCPVPCALVITHQGTLNERGQRKDIFHEDDDTSHKMENSFWKKWTQINSWGQQGRVVFEYSATMNKAGCVREAQSWKQMAQSKQGTNKEASWSKQVDFKRFQGGTQMMEGINQESYQFNSCYYS